MKVFEHMQRKELKGELLGLEIEAEGRNLMVGTDYFDITHDGSLRGTSCEYVLRKPMSYKELVGLALRQLKAAFKESKTRFYNSSRTSIHVHINFSDVELKDLYTFIVVYSIVEDLLVRWCGAGREGNLFCLRFRDASYVMDTLPDHIEGNRLYDMCTNRVRYGALNLAALAKYGSLEFRSMRGTQDFDLIKKWIDILLELKHSASKYPNGVEVVTDYSLLGAEAWLRKIFPTFFDDLSYKGMEYDMDASMRMAQMVAFAEVPPDPPRKQRKKSTKYFRATPLRDENLGTIIENRGARLGEGAAFTTDLRVQIEDLDGEFVAVEE